MKYVVTARKWRPQIFEEIVGQEHISRTIKNAIVTERIAHAFLFAGPRGVGKTTTARILAKALNCKNNKDGEPCNNCETCNAFNSSQSLDIIEIDGASNRRIEEIRSLREAVKYSPTTGSYKIFIIDEVHMLTTESFNALLKTLEEPPEHAIFIFATTDVHKVPLTIISRCQRFDFRRIELDAIKDQLSKIAVSEKIVIDDQALTFISKKADGALRDAQSLFDQVVSFGGKEIDSSTVSQMLNLIDEEIYFKISDAILNKDFLEAFNISKTIYDNGWNYIDFIAGLLEHFRNILTTILKQDTSFVESSEQIKKMYLEYIGTFSESDLLRILTYLSKVERELKISQNQKLLLEISLSHLIGLESTTSIMELVKNIQSGKFPEQPEKKKLNRATEQPQPTKEDNSGKETNQLNSVAQKKTSDSKEPEVKNISNVDGNLTTEESSLINAIINELGGREFK
jgi:DNA polymerase III subunit gamma/tau